MNLEPANYYAMTQNERRQMRLAYVNAQDSRCYCCGDSLDGEPSVEVRQYPINWKLFPPMFLKYPVHLHHNHKTGDTIGAVHALCNAYLWQYHGE